MWRAETKSGLGRVYDTQVIYRDYLVAEGFQGGFSFLEKDGAANPFGGDIRVPMFWVFKLHQGHPLRVTSFSEGHVYIYPENERHRARPRQPAHVFKDRKAYDLATFMMVPGSLEGSEGIASWIPREVADGFRSEGGERSNASLLYGKHGLDVPKDGVLRVSNVMPSHVANHLYAWAASGHRISSHKEFGAPFVDEGMMNLSFEQARYLSRVTAETLEKRFRTRLTFPRGQT